MPSVCEFLKQKNLRGIKKIIILHINLCKYNTNICLSVIFQTKRRKHIKTIPDFAHSYDATIISMYKSEYVNNEVTCYLFCHDRKNTQKPEKIWQTILN